MKINQLKWVLCLLGLSQFWGAAAQVRIEVISFPRFLTSNQQIFIAGTFNDWNPSSSSHELKKSSDNTYFIDLPDTLKRFEYKFTQGNWLLVEGDSVGSLRQNHVFDVAQNPEKTIKVRILSWENKPTYNFVIKKLPENTPHDATLFIAGNFNNWNPQSETHRFARQTDGSYRATVVSELDVLEFKFTRGNWSSVEGWVNGKVRPNRSFNRYAQASNNNRDIDIEIESWEDLSGTFHFFTVYDLLMLFAALQGLLFAVTIPSIKTDNREANRWLMLLMLLCAFAFFFKVVGEERSVATLYPKFLLFPDGILFVYAPIFFFYLKKLLFNTEGVAEKWWQHAILPLCQFFLYLPFFLMDDRSFALKIVTRDAQAYTIFNVVGGVGLLWNAFYWWKSRRLLQFYETAYKDHIADENHVSYINKVLLVQLFCLLLWLFMVILNVGSGIFGDDTPMLLIRSIDTTWLIFSVSIYVLGYYALWQPQVYDLTRALGENKTGYSIGENGLSVSAAQLVANAVKINETIAEEVEKEVVKPRDTEGSKLPDDILEKLKTKIEEYVEREKPYANPNLSLNDLAMKLKLQPHVLSKVINQGFDKNYFDFINSYRVEEFKKRMNNPTFKNYTIISIAYDVGFNSKTAFNRAFKKLTNQTPSQYYNLKNEI